jgi:PAS domain S-box-containing protein
VHDVGNLTLRDLTQCGIALRGMGEGSTSMEEVAGRVVRYLREEFVCSESGEPAFLLGRFFKTHAFGKLPENIAHAAGQGLQGQCFPPETKCLTLLATAGSRPEWCVRECSRDHQVIPFPSAEAVHRAPMIAGLIQALGLDIDAVVKPDENHHFEFENGLYEVFHVPVAAGSPWIPAQAEFVIPFGVQSVVGFGSPLPSGNIFAVIAFSRVPISRETADLFKVLSLSVKLAILPFEGAVFASHGGRTSSVTRQDRRHQTLVARATKSTAMEQLLEVYEGVVIEQSQRLENTSAKNARLLLETEEAERRFRGLVTAAPDAIVLARKDGTVELANRRAEELFQYSADDLKGRPVASLLPGLEAVLDGAGIRGPDDPRGVHPAGDRLMALRRDGSLVPVEVSLGRADAVGTGGVIAVVRDIRFRLASEEAIRKARDEAEAANRLKSAFLANMSHEIRTPMCAILGYIDLLKDKVQGDPEALDYIATTECASRQLLELLNDILDLSRIEADRMELTKARCSVQQIVTELLSVMQVLASQKSLALTETYETVVPETILSDPVRIRQALNNLVGNAIKFTPAGAVEISLRMEAGGEKAQRLLFRVRDTGIGIAGDRIGELFQPFMQVDPAATRKYGGTGLGLAISSRLARALGGDLTVESQLGVGSVFTLAIPCEVPPGTRMLHDLPSRTIAGDTKAEQAPQDLTGVRLLVVEDDPGNQSTLRTKLERIGAHVEGAESGAIAMERMAGRGYDLVLMDVQMPVMDGFQALVAMRQKGIKTPVVALTSHAMKGDHERCLEAGFSGQVAKPVRPEDLLTTVRACLGSSHLGDASPLRLRHAVER